jgi:hypothetical protein
VGSLKGRDCLEHLEIDGKIILKWIFKGTGWVDYVAQNRG